MWNFFLPKVPSLILITMISTKKWHLPRTLPRTEQQRRLPSASMEIEPRCYSCWPSTAPEGVQGGLRHSVLQGIWCDRSLDSSMFLGTDFMISILASPHIKRSTKSLLGDIRSSLLTTKKKTFCKIGASWYWALLSPKPYVLNFPHCRFGAISQSYMRCCLPSCSPHLAPNKT